MQRRSILAALLAIILAPFIRLFERLWPKKPKGYIIQGSDEYVSFGKAPAFDPNEPFSVSCWFKEKASPKDHSYLFVSTSRNKISETTLLDDVTDEQWHTFTARYDGTTKKEPEVYIDSLKPGEKLPPGAIQSGRAQPRT